MPSTYKYSFDNPNAEPNTTIPQINRFINNLIKITNVDPEHKHLIYTDTTTTAKMVAKVISNNLGISSFYDRDGNISLGKGSFAVLGKGLVYGDTLSSKMIKSVKSTFNKRPENIYGTNIRFLIIDQSYKEGLDVFDVRYLHFVDTPPSSKEQQQVIGRATRMCGQKGLPFNNGWKLYVFKYGDNPQHSQQISSLSNITELEKICYYGSVDFDLNSTINRFISPATDSRYKIHNDVLTTIFGSTYKTFKDISSNTKNGLDTKLYMGYKELKKIGGSGEFSKYKNRIVKEYSNAIYRYDQQGETLTNGCISKPTPNQSFELTPTQQFIKSYWTPSNPLKGILLWHSVGTGKTCTGISVVDNFVKKGYKVLWITRHSLIADVEKDAGPERCGTKPTTMTYRTFTNMLNGLNSKENPFKSGNKVLLIIDEVHKLFNGSLKPQERPDIGKLRDVIKGKNVKVMLMTATPITGNNEMDLIKLINLILHEPIPEDPQQFSDKYGYNQGKFNNEGAIKFLDTIAGHISYLDRTGDSSKFAIPIYI